MRCISSVLTAAEVPVTAFAGGSIAFSAAARPRCFLTRPDSCRSGAGLRWRCFFSFAGLLRPRASRRLCFLSPLVSFLRFSFTVTFSFSAALSALHASSVRCFRLNAFCWHCCQLSLPSRGCDCQICHVRHSLDNFWWLAKPTGDTLFQQYWHFWRGVS